MAARITNFMPSLTNNGVQAQDSGAVNIALLKENMIENGSDSQVIQMFDRKKRWEVIKDRIWGLVDFIFKVTGLPIYLKDEFSESVENLLSSFQHRAKLEELQRKPRPRDYRPREGIINYIQAEDGLGPWLRAGVLTRPMIGELSPRAYEALGNFLRKAENRAEYEKLNIPDKSQVVDRELEANASMTREAARLDSARRYRMHYAVKREP